MMLCTYDSDFEGQSRRIERSDCHYGKHAKSIDPREPERLRRKATSMLVPFRPIAVWSPGQTGERSWRILLRFPKDRKTNAELFQDFVEQGRPDLAPAMDGDCHRRLGEPTAHDCLFGVASQTLAVLRRDENLPPVR